MFYMIYSVTLEQQYTSWNILCDIIMHPPTPIGSEGVGGPMEDILIWILSVSVIESVYQHSCLSAL